MRSLPSHVVFAGGVTGGHVFPALAVAEQLRRRASLRMTFLGAGGSKEREWIRRARIPHVTIPSAALTTGILSLPAALSRNVQGYRAARRFLRRERVGVVVGMGGYASAPTARAAIDLGVPLILIEANVVPGRVTRWLARKAEHVCVAFESAREAISTAADVRVTGLPIRPIPRSFADDGYSRVDRQLVILGGSGGAATIDRETPKALFHIRKSLHGWRIIHQAGRDRVEATRRVYARLGLKADVRPFLDDLPSVLGDSTAAITRTGGSILAELAAARLPAVLVPFPRAARDHQRHNAREFAKKTGCPVVEENPREESAGSGRIDHDLADAIASILDDSRRRETIVHLLRRIARPDAADAVVDLLLGLEPPDRKVGGAFHFQPETAPADNADAVSGTPKKHPLGGDRQGGW